MYCTRELAARPVRSSSLSLPLHVRTHVRCSMGIRDREVSDDDAWPVHVSVEDVGRWINALLGRPISTHPPNEQTTCTSALSRLGLY